MTDYWGWKLLQLLSWGRARAVSLMGHHLYGATTAPIPPAPATAAFVVFW